MDRDKKQEEIEGWIDPYEVFARQIWCPSEKGPE